VSNLQGISISNVAIRLRSDKRVIASTTGDLMFTHYGVSGPAILSLSRICVDQLRAGIKPVLLIDILPEHDETQLEQIILRHFEESGKRQVQTIIKYLIPQKMAPLFLSDINIDPTKLCNQVTSDERNKIVQHLKCFEIKVTGHRSFAEAMVTAGGVSLKEINPQTMESRLIKGLYFAGEVLDLDADTGGFNLQAAFSTGWLAGKMCLQETIV
jgi:predicted Rossmann fold flavoprotein